MKPKIKTIALLAISQVVALSSYGTMAHGLSSSGPAEDFLFILALIFIPIALFYWVYMVFYLLVVWFGGRAFYLKLTIPFLIINCLLIVFFDGMHLFYIPWTLFWIGLTVYLGNREKCKTVQA